MVLLKDKEVLEKQIKNLNKQIEQKQNAEQLYQQKIQSIEKDLQNEKQDKAKLKEKLDILETISNKPKKEVSTETDLNWDEKMRELYEKVKIQNTKEEQLFNKIEELKEENKSLKKEVNELEKILEPYTITTLTITECDKDNILQPLLKYRNLTTLNWKNTQLKS